MDLVGQTLSGGRYRITERLGAGGFGSVWKGIHVGFGGLPVAIKILHDSVAHDDTLVRHFKREGKAMAVLRHDNIVRVFDCGSEGELHYLVMELLNGTVRDRLGNGPMPLRDVVEVTKDVARGLSELHAKGFVHRDIKPGNIMFGQSGKAVITDLGLVSSGEFTMLSDDHTMVGSAPYMSPEQWEPARGELDARSDLYALGCTIFQMATGRPPFEGSVPELMTQHLGTRAPNLKELRPEVDLALAKTVSRLLEKRPADRHVDAAALVLDLERLDQAKAVSADADTDPVTIRVSKDSPTQTVDRPILRRPRAWFFWPAVLGIPVVAGAVLLAAMLLRRPPAPALVSPASGSMFAANADVAFEWSRSRAGLNYIIQIDDATDFAEPLLLDRKVDHETRYAAGALPSGTMYWRTRAIDASGRQGNWSEVRSFVIAAPAIAAPSPIAPVSGARIDEGAAVRFEWASVNGAESYGLEVDDSPDFSPPLVIEQTVSGSTSFPATGLAVGELWWRVRAHNGAGQPGPWSDSLALIVVRAASLKPPSLQSPAKDLVSASGTAVDFVWSAVTSAESYTLQVDDAQTFAAPLIVEKLVPGSPRHSASGLPEGTLWWRVRANGAGGSTSEWSDARRLVISGYGRLAVTSGLTYRELRITDSTGREFCPSADCSKRYLTLEEIRLPTGRYTVAIVGASSTQQVEIKQNQVARVEFPEP